MRQQSGATRFFAPDKRSGTPDGSPDRPGRTGSHVPGAGPAEAGRAQGLPHFGCGPGRLFDVLSAAPPEPSLAEEPLHIGPALIACMVIPAMPAEPHPGRCGSARASLLDGVTSSGELDRYGLL